MSVYDINGNPLIQEESGIYGKTPIFIKEDGLYIKPNARTNVYSDNVAADNLMTRFQTVEVDDKLTYGTKQPDKVEVISAPPDYSVSTYAHIYGFAAEPGEYTLQVTGEKPAFIRVTKRAKAANLTQAPGTNVVSGYVGDVINFEVTADDVGGRMCNIGVKIAPYRTDLPATFAAKMVKGRYDTMPEGNGMSFVVQAGERFYLNCFNGQTVRCNNPEPVYKDANACKGTLVCLGDSLTQMTEYPQHISALGMPAINLGVTASTLRPGSDPQGEMYPYTGCQIADSIVAKDMTTQIAGGKNPNFKNLLNLLNSADGIVLEYGTNDYNGDCTFVGDDIQSIQGALRHALTQLYTAYPRVQIYVVSTFMYSYAYGAQPVNPNGTVRQMNEAMEATCKEFATPFISLIDESGFNQITRHELTGDQLHPDNPQGMKRMAQVMYALLRAHGRN